MTQEHPGLRDPDPGLEPPTQELKIVGTPEIQDEHTNADHYRVRLKLSRKLTPPEQDAGGHAAFTSTVGAVSVDRSDMQHLIINDTTIEKVAQHGGEYFGQFLQDIVRKGEDVRLRTIEARKAAEAKARADEEERARRRKLAGETDFG